MPILNKVIPTLKSLVDEGLYVDNLQKIENLTQGLLILGEYPTVFFVLKTICQDLKNLWEDHAVPVEEYNYVQAKLNGPIQYLLTSIQLNKSNESIVEQLDTLIREFTEVKFYLQRVSNRVN